MKKKFFQGPYPLLNAIKSNLFSGDVPPTSPTSRVTNRPTSQYVTNPQTSSYVSKNSDITQNRLVCYHTNWSQYRPGTQKFFPDNIDPSLCTHIIYSFAKFTNYELAAYEWNDENMDWSKGLYQKTIDLKLKNPNLKVLLAVGGSITKLIIVWICMLIHNFFFTKRLEYGLN